MSDRRLFLLSAYRLPTHYPVSMDTDEMTAWLTGYLSLWHPALLRGAAAPPEVASTYDHDPPRAEHVYCLPETNTAVMADDWTQRARDGGSIVYAAVPDRRVTLGHIREALPEDQRGMMDLPEERVRPFYAIGFGYAIIQALFEAMDHEPLLDAEEFWNSVATAAERVFDAEAFGEAEARLRDAANHLIEARERLYHVPIYVLDFCAVEPDRPEVLWPASLHQGMPLNVIATGEDLRKLASEQNEKLDVIRPLIEQESEQGRLVTICGGIYRERDDGIMPAESQLWNIRAGQEATREVLGKPAEVFARLTSAYHPHIPSFLLESGLNRALIWALDGAVVPAYYSPIVSWPGPDGKAIDIFTRAPVPADKVETFFNLASKINEALTQDSAPTVALLHHLAPACPFYHDWLELAKLGPVLGQWCSLDRYFTEAMAGDYAGPSSIDDFFCDYLDDRVNAKSPNPVSVFTHQAHWRRRIDTTYALAALHRSLGGDPSDQERDELRQLSEIEAGLELGDGDQMTSLTHLEEAFAGRLAARLQSRSEANRPGFMILNSSSYARRVALELEGITGPLPVGDFIKAAQFDADKARLVIEVPALGFAWIPKEGPPGTPEPVQRILMAEETVVRNEFFEADVDPVTGGLRAFRDPRTRLNRFGQMLMFQPGSKMKCHSLEVTHNGAALGEIVTQGVLVNEHDEVLAEFRQRFRAWLGRPVLDIRIELTPIHKPTGYAWHAYYGSRFAWSNENAPLMRGSHGLAMHTSHTRPVSTEFVDIRIGPRSTTVFSAGLPFIQRHGNRMLDVILIPEGENETVFELAIAMDRENLAQVAQSLVTPPVVVTTEKGPPHVGPSGWLAHLDATNLLMTSLRPGEGEGHERAVIARLQEVFNYGGAAEMRFVRDPVAARLLDGAEGVPLHVNGDSVPLEFSAGELLCIRVDFS